MEPEVFYSSTNGDTWSLAQDPTTRRKAVLHRPNGQSGGRASYTDVDQFLESSANGPEHQALRRLMEAAPKPSSVLIVYDVHPPTGDTYDELVDAIRSLGTWWHHLETAWIVQSVFTRDDILERLKPRIGSEDQLLVVDLASATVACAGVNKPGEAWLVEKLGSRATTEAVRD